MASAGLEQFYRKIVTDHNLQIRLKAAPTMAAFIETAVKLGQEHGYSFTAQDVRARVAANSPDGELTEDELDEMSGGGGSDLLSFAGDIDAGRN